LIIRIIAITSLNIKALNLNWLPVLAALLDERNVTRAARRLGMTQPAVSNVLAHLRAHFDDALLIRSGNRMLLTERANALRPQLSEALARLEAALDPSEDFDPASLSATFTVETTDYVGFVLGPTLLRRLEREAPNVRLHFRAWPHHRVPKSLARGETDLMLGFYDQVPPGHRDQRLFQDEFVCIVRKAHPSVGKRLTLKRYLSLRHVLVTQEPDALGVVDLALAPHGLRRDVALRLSHFLLVPPVVAATDYVAAIDRRVAAAFCQTLPLRALPPPLALPGGWVGQVWHERTQDSRAHAWLRALITDVSAGL
jgi:DNA-binding transcriptional LysR family regulator